MMVLCMMVLCMMVFCLMVVCMMVFCLVLGTDLGCCIDLLGHVSFKLSCAWPSPGKDRCGVLLCCVPLKYASLCMIVQGTDMCAGSDPCAVHEHAVIVMLLTLNQKRNQ